MTDSDSRSHAGRRRFPRPRINVLIRPANSGPIIGASETWPKMEFQPARLQLVMDKDEAYRFKAILTNALGTLTAVRDGMRAEDVSVRAWELGHEDTFARELSDLEETVQYLQTFKDMIPE